MLMHDQDLVEIHRYGVAQTRVLNILVEGQGAVVIVHTAVIDLAIAVIIDIVTTNLRIRREGGGVKVVAIVTVGKAIAIEVVTVQGFLVTVVVDSIALLFENAWIDLGIRVVAIQLIFSIDRFSRWIGAVVKTVLVLIEGRVNGRLAGLLDPIALWRLVEAELGYTSGAHSE
jgi:hypothetical protein